MNRFVRSGVGALALCALSLAGCDTKRLWLQVSGLDDGVTDGVWLWRLSEVNGTYERTCRFAFEGTDAVGNLETLAYIQECDDGRLSSNFSVPINRSPNQPDTVTVGLRYQNWFGAGVYKISSYGLYGETSLSGSTLQL